MKTKIKTVYRCTQCEQDAPRWLGQCPHCQAWNTLEATVLKPGIRPSARESYAAQAQVLSFSEECGAELTMERYGTGFSLLDAALGGGLLDSSLVLLGGAPGIGKSTLVAHLAHEMANRHGHRVLLASGEEATQQIASRLSRLGIPKSEKLFLSSNLPLESVLAKTEELEPKLLIVDSIQTLSSEELGYPIGSPSLIRAVSSRLLELSKNKKMIVLLLGHVTKDGFLAGPKHMEHMVDVVLQMEKPRAEDYRVLRVAKNRFGSTHHLVVFTMTESGLAQVLDPSAAFISGEWRERLAGENRRMGLAASVAMEGSQPFLIQAEALVGARKMSPGKRASLGIERNRLEMLVAVLEKTTGITLESCDVYLSLLGGVRLRDPGVDLALAMALASSALELTIPTTATYAGEISLSGDVLKPRDLETRVRQSKNLGYAGMLYAQKGLSHLRDFIRQLKGD